jgi:methylthioxylose transferase
VVLAAVRGWDRIVAPVLAPREYLAAVPRTADATAFLESFVHRLPHLPVHVQGHPPGPVLLGLGLRELGLGAPSWFAGVLIAGGTLVVPATLVTVREVAGEAWARRALPFLVLGPAAVWMVTSADALFAGAGALGVALVTLATRPRRSRDLLAVLGGMVLGLAAFLSYGLVLLALVPLVIAWRRGAWRAIALAALGALGVLLAFALAGFWWFDGLAATHRQYLAGIASRRPYLPFLAVDLAAFALVVGPATAVGLARLRDRRLWLVVGGGLLAVGVALLSGMAKGEVERIWLPFAPWLLVAAAAVWSLGERRRVVGLLGLQAGAAILLEALIRTPW